MSANPNSLRQTRAFRWIFGLGIGVLVAAAPADSRADKKRPPSTADDKISLTRIRRQPVAPPADPQVRRAFLNEPGVPQFLLALSELDDEASRRDSDFGPRARGILLQHQNDAENLYRALEQTLDELTPYISKVDGAVSQLANKALQEVAREYRVGALAAIFFIGLRVYLGLSMDDQGGRVSPRLTAGLTLIGINDRSNDGFSLGIIGSATTVDAIGSREFFRVDDPAVDGGALVFGHLTEDLGNDSNPYYEKSLGKGITFGWGHVGGPAPTRRSSFAMPRTISVPNRLGFLLWRAQRIERQLENQLRQFDFRSVQATAQKYIRVVEELERVWVKRFPGHHRIPATQAKPFRSLGSIQSLFADPGNGKTLLAIEDAFGNPETSPLAPPQWAFPIEICKPLFE